MPGGPGNKVDAAEGDGHRHAAGDDGQSGRHQAAEHEDQGDERHGKSVDLDLLRSLKDRS